MEIFPEATFHRNSCSVFELHCTKTVTPQSSPTRFQPPSVENSRLEFRFTKVGEFGGLAIYHELRKAGSVYAHNQVIKIVGYACVVLPQCQIQVK